MKSGRALEVTNAVRNAVRVCGRWRCVLDCDCRRDRQTTKQQDARALGGGAWQKAAAAPENTSSNITPHSIPPPTPPTMPLAALKTVAKSQVCASTLH